MAQKKEVQLENLKSLISRVGQAGIPVFGYDFSIAGVCGRITGPFARGGAISVGMDGGDATPIPDGMVWNMVYNPQAPSGILPEITEEQFWSRAAYFLNALLPVAQEVGVCLAAHPDDPPLPRIRRQTRLVHQPYLYDRLIQINSSPSNQIELKNFYHDRIIEIG